MSPVAPERPVRVVNEQVLQGRDRTWHTFLSLFGLASIAVFGAMWIRDSWTGHDPWLTALVAALLSITVAVWLAQWFSMRRMARPMPMPAREGLRVAAVTTFVGTHESLAMLKHTLGAMCHMRVKHDTWVLDEGDSGEVRALCGRLGARHFTRANMPRYQQHNGTYRAASKHGNYNAWLDQVGFESYDVLVMFDPDHVPDESYLARTLGYLRDEEVAFVQPPQYYYNQDAGFVARAAAEESYDYYSTHLMASYALGHTVVVGSHGVHRLTALRAVGGFPSHDAEDLYLTMLYRAAGWRGVFVPEILAMGTTPVDWASYLRQQLRWSRSVIDLKLRVLPRVGSKLSVGERMMNLAHGAFYLRALLVPVAYAILGYLLTRNESPDFLRVRPMLSAATLIAALSVLDQFRQRFYLDPEREGGIPWRASVMQLAKWPVFCRAVIEAVMGRDSDYLLTPKGTNGPRTRALAPVQLGVAALLTLAWAVGEVRNPQSVTPLSIAGLVVVLTCLAIAASDALPSVAKFREDLYNARRAALRRTSPQQSSA